MEDRFAELQSPALRRMVATGILVALMAIAIFDSVTSLHPVQPPFTISQASLTQTNNGEISLEVHITNTGTRPLSVSGTLLNQFVPPLNFQPNVIQPQLSSIGSSKSVWQLATFDGSSTYIQTPNSISLNSRTMSLETVFKYASLAPDQQMLIGKGQAGQNSFYFYSFRSANNTNDFVVYENNTRYDQQLGDIFAANVWYDVVFTIDGREITAFVNGEPMESWSHPISFLGNQEDLFIGSCSCGGYYFNGSIATIRLYDRALSPSEVRLNYEDLNPVTAGLSMLYQLNKTSGDIEQDLSGQGNNGVINGSLSYHPPLTWGEYYNVIITATINQGQEFSLDVAVRLT